MTEHPALRSRADDILSWDGHVACMLRFEAALATAQSHLGIIPASAAAAIREACEWGIDRDALAARSATAATPVIPLAETLREAVGDDHSRFVHHGATSQDTIDTALVLQVRDGIDVLLEELTWTGEELCGLAEEHRRTLMAGRTLLQHAVPITFGVTVAHWLAALARHVGRLRALRDDLPVQLGGAAGTLAPFGPQGPELTERLAAELDLRVPLLPWHTDRDLLHGPVAAAALAAGTLGKIARDVASLSRSEVKEVSDPGAGGSSTMPQKANPVDPAMATASALLAVDAAGTVLRLAFHEHERAVGAWQAEWVAVPRVLRHAIAAAERLRTVIERLEIDPARMLHNLELTDGAVMAEAVMLALSPHLGRSEATAAVSRAAQHAHATGRWLGDALRQDDRVTRTLGDELDRILDPASYLGSNDVFIDRALAAWQELAV